MLTDTVQGTPSTRSHQVSHPALHSSGLHADRLCMWYQPNKCVWRLCGCVSLNPLLHLGGGDVDGGGGCAHVPEVGHRVCSHHHQVHYRCVTGLLV